ncbi:MAG TPA: LysR family transcriptional regulator [Alcanivorax sp.]|jgi:LysR family transcriptional regulator, flagellar master operon regulator|nr:LysR family transcriptional regulator [Alcanivorax sp.]MBA4731012.1 LysR family transcriptional regulator [Alcanivorax sp.]HBU64802.1 LysR family transcriptional regulator [Alcanivorax sp.]HCQ34532.1 LysR family transcriptional regulator [Alcanivorax sp.]|tara:strand:- start:199 stop:1044 length:846 start_codon:yes stop_codon:yes gene_type:complete
MDIELARTFLEIVRSGSFMAAAERLHVTQTTVTARVHNLEGQLGCRLFVRNRSGARLTTNGEQFATHASQLVRTWDAARRALPLPEGAGQVLTLGGEVSLWNPWLLNWLSALREACPNVAVRAEVGERTTLHEKLEQSVLDAALVHQPDYWPGMQVEQLMEEKLILVRRGAEEAPYVYVDWGADFRRQHDSAWPERARAAINVDLGPLALRYLLRHGGSGYFRTRVVQPYLESGELERVPAAPEFSYPVYLVYAREQNSELTASAFEALRASLTERDEPPK